MHAHSLVMKNNLLLFTLCLPLPSSPPFLPARLVSFAPLSVAASTVKTELPPSPTYSLTPTHPQCPTLTPTPPQWPTLTPSPPQWPTLTPSPSLRPPPVIVTYIGPLKLRPQEAGLASSHHTHAVQLTRYLACHMLHMKPKLKRK